MIQRIQSVFLLILVIAMVSVLFLPLWSKTTETGETVELTAFSLSSHATNPDAAPANTGAIDQNTMAIAGLAIIIGLVALYEIFQYKTRFTQIKLGLLNSLLLAALLGTIFYYSSYVGDEMVKTKVPGSYEAGFYLPILGLIVNALANRFIKRDEDLVRSVDRLR